MPSTSLPPKRLAADQPTSAGRNTKEVLAIIFNNPHTPLRPG